MGGRGGCVKGRIAVPNIPGDKWESQSTQGKKTIAGCSENPMVLILMRVSLPSKLRKTEQPK